MLEFEPMSAEKRRPAQTGSELIVIGSGPAGLSAAINAESERVNTLVIDDRPEIGGQASLTSMVVNYPGFPHGISGPNLMSAMIDQALLFDTQFIGPTRVNEITPTDDGIAVGTDDGEIYEGKYVLISTGVERRALKARNVAAYKGRGVNYGPPATPESYKNKSVIVIGAGNSAGQAAHRLSEFEACDVHMLIRGESIEEQMSGYLIDNLQKQNVSIHTNTELVGVDGDGRLDRVKIKNNKTEEETELKANEVFVFIGANPRTLWLPETIEHDERGYILAGSELPEDIRGNFIEQTKGRKPLSHETSMPGVFTAGDVRYGSIKRIASAVGDGVGVVTEVHALRATK